MWSIAVEQKTEKTPFPARRKCDTFSFKLIFKISRSPICILSQCRFLWHQISPRLDTSVGICRPMFSGLLNTHKAPISRRWRYRPRQHQGTCFFNHRFFSQCWKCWALTRPGLFVANYLLQSKILCPGPWQHKCESSVLRSRCRRWKNDSAQKEPWLKPIEAVCSGQHAYYALCMQCGSASHSAIGADGCGTCPGRQRLAPALRSGSFLCTN